MTPCGYDGSNHQFSSDEFGVLDLWCGLNVGYGTQGEADNEIYLSIPHRNDVRLPL